MLDKTRFKPRKSHLIREHPLLKLLEGAPPWYYHIHSQASYVERPTSSLHSKLRNRQSGYHLSLTYKAIQEIEKK